MSANTRAGILLGIVFGAIFCFGIARAEARAYPVPQLPSPMPHVHYAECPVDLGNGLRPLGCASDTDVWVAERSDRETLNHELGHIQEARLDDGERNRWRRITSNAMVAWVSADLNDVTSPSEEFADQYADCRVRRFKRDRGLCAFIRRALSD